MGSRWVCAQLAAGRLLGSASLLLSRNGADSKQPCTHPPFFSNAKLRPKLFALSSYCISTTSSIFVFFLIWKFYILIAIFFGRVQKNGEKIYLIDSQKNLFNHELKSPISAQALSEHTTFQNFC